MERVSSGSRHVKCRKRWTPQTGVRAQTADRARWLGIGNRVVLLEGEIPSYVKVDNTQVGEPSRLMVFPGVPCVLCWSVMTVIGRGARQAVGRTARSSRVGGVIGVVDFGTERL